MRHQKIIFFYGVLSILIASCSPVDKGGNTGTGVFLGGIGSSSSGTTDDLEINTVFPKTVRFDDLITIQGSGFKPGISISMEYEDHTYNLNYTIESSEEIVATAPNAELDCIGPSDCNMTLSIFLPGGSAKVDFDEVIFYRKTDADQDGLADLYEETICGDPAKVDGDGDQLSDYDECIVFADCEFDNEDTDGDGIEDSLEVAEHNACTKNGDFDGDGSPDHKDCASKDAGRFPGNFDLPDDGIDTDCSIARMKCTNPKVVCKKGNCDNVNFEPIFCDGPDADSDEDDFDMGVNINHIPHGDLNLICYSVDVIVDPESVDPFKGATVEVHMKRQKNDDIKNNDLFIYEVTGESDASCGPIAPIQGHFLEEEIFEFDFGEEGSVCDFQHMVSATKVIHNFVKIEQVPGKELSYKFTAVHTAIDDDNIAGVYNDPDETLEFSCEFGD